MEQKRIARYLTAAGALAALVVAVIFFLYVPLLGQQLKTVYPELRGFFWPVLIGAWIIAGLYVAALADYFRICARIGQDRSFCRENAQGLLRIARMLFIAAGLIVLDGLLPCALGHVGNAAWLFFVLAAVIASGAMGVLAWGLGRLLTRAVALKEENDLTV